MKEFKASAVANLLVDWSGNKSASDDALELVSGALNVVLPEDYIQFMREHDGGEGFIGDNYLILWRFRELSIFNEEYEVQKYAAGLVLFGSDGGGEAYGYDFRALRASVVKVPFVGMDMQYVEHVADSFSEFLIRLAHD